MSFNDHLIELKRLQEFASDCRSRLNTINEAIHGPSPQPVSVTEGPDTVASATEALNPQFNSVISNIGYELMSIRAAIETLEEQCLPSTPLQQGAIRG